MARKFGMPEFSRNAVLDRLPHLSEDVVCARCFHIQGFLRPIGFMKLVRCEFCGGEDFAEIEDAYPLLVRLH